MDDTQKIYIQQLREAQSIFRNQHHSHAFELAKELHIRYPNAIDIKIFHDAVARSILASAKKLLLSENYKMAIFYARLLLGIDPLEKKGLEIILEAARSGLDTLNRTLLLYNICQNDPKNIQYWREIALCIEYLPPSEEHIEIGFEVLEVIPGHIKAIDGLATLIKQITESETIEILET